MPKATEIYSHIRIRNSFIRVPIIGVSNSFANALLGTVLALAFHPIKNRMEHALKRIGPRTTPEPVTP